MADFLESRERMVAEQIEQRERLDPRVLDAMRRVPRHLFVPVEQQGRAYADCALPIGEGQTISQPYMVAVMTDALHVGPRARVLEVGTGSGYQAAVLARLVAQVMTIELKPALAEAARRLFASLDYHNITVVVGDGSVGYEPRAPYDAVIVTAGAPRRPTRLAAQLVDGGRLVVPVGPELQQELLVIERQGKTLTETRRLSCAFVPLFGIEGWPRM